MLLRIWEGGMSFHGGLLGVVAAAWWWSRRHRLHLFDTIDFVAPLVPPGLGFGRLGNYIGGELWGKYTEAGWGVVFPRARRSSPAWTCEQICRRSSRPARWTASRAIPRSCTRRCSKGLVMFVVLWWFSRKPRPRYAVSGLFALLYGCFRFLVEFVRVPDAADRLPRLRLADDGPGAEPAADRAGPVLAVVVAPRSRRCSRSRSSRRS